jgi:nitrogen fixation/metabolism regulation signal transduction histidine kinase
MINIEPRLVSCERDSYDQILFDHKRIVEDVSINSIVHNLPASIVIVNDKRQLVYLNKAFFEMMNIKESKTVLGMRIGDLIRCVNALQLDNGCGTGEQCRVCGAFRAILECLETGKTVSHETHFRVITDSGECSLEYHVTAVPLMYNSKNYAVVTLQDISGKNRRKALERIFFHDVINYSSALLGALDLLSENPKKFSDLIPILGSTARMLFNEINSQKILVLAENNELEVSASIVDLTAIIKNVIKIFSVDIIGKGKQIEFLTDVSVKCNVDSVLIERVIVNLLKNALEASGTGSTVKIYHGICNKGAFISVQNDRAMSNEVKYQIFQKSFSTKGNGRGLGTFSIKLLTERYLKGSVSFESNDNVGTIFRVEFPI